MLWAYNLQYIRHNALCLLGGCLFVYLCCCLVCVPIPYSLNFSPRFGDLISLCPDTDQLPTNFILSFKPKTKFG